MHFHCTEITIKTPLFLLLCMLSTLSFATIPDDTSLQRIIGGRDLAQGKQPWLVSLQDDREHFCGGSLIAPRWILTAAHCLENYTQRTLDRLTIQFNTVNITGSTHTQFAHAAHLYCHPNSQVDLGLIKLTRPVMNVPYLALADNDAMEEAAFSGVLATISGWGVTREGSYSMPTTPKFTEIPLVPHAYCMMSYDDSISNHEFCAGYANGGTDACQGDSGGPLVIMHNGRNVQAGIISWGSGCARPFMFGVYTRVASFYEWIHSIMTN